MLETNVSESTRTRAALIGTFGGAALGLAAYFSGGLGDSRDFAVMGSGGYLVVGIAVAAALGHFMVTRQPHSSPLRSALALGLAAAPLVVSLAWAALSLAKVETAILGVVGTREMLIPRGMSEALMVVVLGGYLTSGLSVGIGFTLDGPFDRGRGRARTTSWFLFLFLLAGAFAFVVGGFCDRIARSGVIDAPAFASSALVAVSDARWNSLVAIGIATVAAVRAAVKTMRVPSDYQGDWVLPVGLTGAVALAVAALVVVAVARANSMCRSWRPEGFARHLDAFAPLSIPGGEHGDSGAVVLVPDLVVEGAHRDPPTEALFRSLASRRADAFAIDARVDHATLEMLVRAFASTESESIRIVGVASDAGWFEVEKRLATVPLFGAVLPVVASRTVHLRVADDVPHARSLRVVLRHGGSAYAPEDSRGAAVPPEPGELVTLVLGPDATTADVLTAVAQFEPATLTRLVTSDVVLPESAAPELALAEAVEAPPPSSLEAAHTEIHDIATDPGILRDLLGTAPPETPAPGATPIDRNDLVSSMRRFSPQARRCYESALERNPTLEGRATLSVTIGPGGRATRAEVTSTDLPESVTECIARAARAAAFPDPGTGSMTVSFPFVFHAN